MRKWGAVWTAGREKGQLRDAATKGRGSGHAAAAASIRAAGLCPALANTSFLFFFFFPSEHVIELSKDVSVLLLLPPASDFLVETSASASAQHDFLLILCRSVVDAAALCFEKQETLHWCRSPCAGHYHSFARALFY